MRKRYRAVTVYVKSALQCNNPTAQLLCSCSISDRAANDEFEPKYDVMPFGIWN
jgi:hypothetical protein